MDTESVIETFALLDNWEARYEFIAELSRELLPLAEQEKTDANLVPGCNTLAWLRGDLRPGEPPTIEFRADAETPMVRGLMALLLVPFQGKTPAQILATDAHAYINKLGLREHLSPNRREGIEHLLERVRQIAHQFEQGG